MLALFQSYWRRITGRGSAARRPRARHLGARFESLESRCVLSLAPATIPFIADGYRPAASLNADAAYSGDSNDSAASPAQSLDRGAESETYPSDGLTRPISPAPTWPSVPSANVPAYTPPADNDSYSPLPGRTTPSDQIDISPSYDLQSSPQNTAELPGDKSEARDVLDMLAALHYVPSKQVSKETASPSLTPLRSGDDETLPPADALGAAKDAKASDDDGIVLQRHPIAESSLDASLSAAAIDALLEIPARIESVHSAFQQFEVSAGVNAPLPIAPASRERPEADVRPSATDVSLTFGENSALLGARLAPVAGQAPAPAAESPADAAIAGQPPLGAIDELTILDRRLDLITAALISALIGRAVWKFSTETTAGQQPTPANGEPRPPLRRECLPQRHFGYTVLDPRG